MTQESPKRLRAQAEAMRRTAKQYRRFAEFADSAQARRRDEEEANAAEKSAAALEKRAAELEALHG
jgi:hypothetical protein